MQSPHSLSTHPEPLRWLNALPPKKPLKYEIIMVQISTTDY